MEKQTFGSLLMCKDLIKFTGGAKMSLKLKARLLVW